ncbi:TAXI family TRAP transporter solute-binding subunit [Okeania sp. SIO2B3]|uniref:TAXI family TRAP transporter solute-binding subunit n=1 Tax=Okeania sp. SIO2B3 TaxID=2607784 RepID=UPI0013C1A09B|nr:TAXI family TRAP transporter solute-binding subunit [Okeania sp. SIO2B3]NET42357.1 TAXI family TRAP transporter solute-binding subunit [Okeania sp. SIO2B3]
MYKNRKAIPFVLGVTITLIFALAVHAQSSYTVGTGGTKGVYYPVGGAIAKIVDEAKVGIQLTVESTAGSVFNLKALNSGQLDIAIAQSDVVDQDFFSNQQASLDDKKLRSVMALYPEPLHLVCSSESGVNSFPDIKGKRINIGSPGSGQLNIVRDLLEVYGIEESEFTAQSLRPSEASDSLRDGNSDCFFYAVGIGSVAIQDIFTTSDVKIVPLKDPVLDQLIKKFPYYTYTTLPAGTYKGQNAELTLFGVKALLVTTTELSEDIVYNIVKSIIGKFDQFKGTHQALKNLTPKAFVEGLGAPLHPGAVRAYQEVGFSFEVNDEIDIKDLELDNEPERTNQIDS